MKEYDRILWDFNGTLLDDVRTGIESINVLLGRRGLPLLSCREDYHRHFRFPVTDYYRSIGLDLDAEDFDDLAVEWMEQYLHFVQTAGLCPGAREMLTLFRDAGLPQTLFSASERTLLHKQLTQLGILPFFDEILGMDNIRAESKIRLGLDWIARHRGERVVLIGDTDHDRDAAARMGIDCILVAAGHQPKSRLRTCGVPVLGSLSELPEYILS